MRRRLRYVFQGGQLGQDVFQYPKISKYAAQVAAIAPGGCEQLVADAFGGYVYQPGSCMADQITQFGGDLSVQILLPGEYSVKCAEGHLCKAVVEQGRKIPARKSLRHARGRSTFLGC